MFEIISNILKAVFSAVPPDSAECTDERTKERHMHWRRSVFSLLVILACGLGYVAINYAAESVVDEKVQAAIKPIQQKVDEIAKNQEEAAQKVAQLATQSSSTNRLLIAKLASDLEDKIVQSTILRCKAQSDQSSEYFRVRVQEFIEQYVMLTGRDKKAPTCSDTR